MQIFYCYLIFFTLAKQVDLLYFKSGSRQIHDEIIPQYVSRRALKVILT